ncbi:MAG: hypothetical protein ACRDE2_00215 [Chitinophagaceae bacterium]
MKESSEYSIITDNDRILFEPIKRSFLSNHFSSERKIKSNGIVMGLRKNGYKIDDAGFRRIIGYLRSIDYFNPGFVLSDINGYWYSEDISEMKRFYSSMKFRALSILHNIKPIYQKLKISEKEETSLFETL